jgi:hypothetical protein
MAPPSVPDKSLVPPVSNGVSKYIPTAVDIATLLGELDTDEDGELEAEDDGEDEADGDAEAEAELEAEEDGEEDIDEEGEVDGEEDAEDEVELEADDEGDEETEEDGDDEAELDGELISSLLRATKKPCLEVSETLQVASTFPVAPVPVNVFKYTALEKSEPSEPISWTSVQVFP